MNRWQQRLTHHPSIPSCVQDILNRGRLVVHLYFGADGGIKETQTLFVCSTWTMCSVLSTGRWLISVDLALALTGQTFVVGPFGKHHFLLRWSNMIIPGLSLMFWAVRINLRTRHSWTHEAIIIIDIKQCLLQLQGRHLISAVNIFALSPWITATYFYSNPMLVKSNDFLNVTKLFGTITQQKSVYFPRAHVLWFMIQGLHY